jgi:hypothetical protein
MLYPSLVNIDKPMVTSADSRCKHCEVCHTLVAKAFDGAFQEVNFFLFGGLNSRV